MDLARYSDMLSDLWREASSRVTWKVVMVTAGVSGASYTIYSFFVKPFLSPLRKIPGPEYSPLFGNVREAMRGEAMQSSVSWVKQYGGIVRFYHLFGRERILVADPRLLKEIFVTNVDNYCRLVANPRVLGQGIFNSSGDNHRFQRRLMNPFFNHQHIEGYLKIFNAKSRQLVEFWEKTYSDGGEVNVQEDLLRMALDVIGEAAFGYQFNCLEKPSSEVHSAFRTVMSQQVISFSRLIPFFDKIPTKKNRELTASIKLIDDIIYDIIKKKTHLFVDQDNTDSTNSDFLGKLMQVRDTETGSVFSEKQLRDQVMSLLAAGTDTTSITLSWLLLLLAQHPDIQDKVRSEVSQWSEKGRDLTWEQIDRMKYLSAVVKETQRLYPVAPSNYRLVVRDTHLGGYFLPKGTRVVFHVGAMMRNPSVWQDPECFRPERFLGDDDIDLYHYLPFITGPHKCLGHQFAKMEMRTVLARLVANFKFKVRPDAKFTRKLRITMRADPPVTLLISKV